MQFLLILINCFICFIATTSAAYFIGNFSDPDYPGKCVLKNEGIILAAGENIQNPEYCGNIKCAENGFVTKISCLIHYVPEGCKLIKPLDANSDYPDCCDKGVSCNDIPRD